MQEPILYDILRQPENEPLVLTGPPAGLTTRLELHNPGEANVVLRGADVKDPTGALISRPLPLSFPTVVLHPGQGRTVPLTVALDPATPPGDYQVELVLGGQSRTVILHVTEVFDLTLSPASVVVMNQPGREQRKRIIVANTGNVPFTIGDIGDIKLVDDVRTERIVRLGIEPQPVRADVDIDELVVALLRIARKEAERAGSLSVHNLSGGVKVAPGETRHLELAITVQDDLPRHGRYRGLAPVLTQDLEIIVVSSGDIGSYSPPEQKEWAENRPRKRRSRQGKPSGE